LSQYISIPRILSDLADPDMRQRLLCTIEQQILRASVLLGAINLSDLVEDNVSGSPFALTGCSSHVHRVVASDDQSLCTVNELRIKHMQSSRQ